MKRILVLLLVAMTTSLQGFAIVRSQQVMKEIANRQLQQMGINGMVTLPDFVTQKYSFCN